MTVELRPLGVKCNIKCKYCYQNPQREAGAVLHHYDIDAMKLGIKQAGGPFTLFGGEPLLVPKRDLEQIWAWGLEEFGRNAIQTNGALIDEQHIELFRRYNVKVGMSIDGPGSLNDIRWAGSLDKTRRATARTESAIARLCELGIPPSLIVTLHRENATADKLETLTSWLNQLDLMGVSSVGLHLLEVESPDIRERFALSIEENIAALHHLVAIEHQLKTLKFPLFNTMRRLLSGDDRKASCVWNGCDSYTTRAVQGVEGNGQRSNCGRTNKDGIDFTKGDLAGYERYLALYLTPQAYGGCSGCRFFSMCKGQCPGTAIDLDWRNRTEYCNVWMSLFSYFERELEQAGRWVLSQSTCRREVEAALTLAWRAGRSASLFECVRAHRPANTL
ncbi:radical SAM protein [Paraburkholderia sediminicola]|jgi:uncharacterized protein|uniref:radical SAM protein n=1 Tax=Paraburkholderia sediminicola TaxID=458836 RepID=UPI0038B9BF10